MLSLLRKQKPEEKTRSEIQEETTEETTVIIDFPNAKLPEVSISANQQAAYEEIAESIGFEPAELIRSQLLKFFRAENIKLYNLSEVTAWLTQKRQEVKAHYWCWRPLRKKDIITDFKWGWVNHNREDGFYTSENSACRPYARLIPQHVLEKIKKIAEAFGDKVKFFVSDYIDPNDDPNIDPNVDLFIMVRPTQQDDEENNYLLVFDVWDKPGFSG